MFCSSGMLRDCREHLPRRGFRFETCADSTDRPELWPARSEIFPLIFHSTFVPNHLFRSPNVSSSLSPCVSSKCVSRFLPPPDSCRPGILTNCCAAAVAPIMQILRSILCATALERLMVAHPCSPCPVWSQDIRVVVAHFHACSGV